ncbi:MAG: c-type cytochrome [Gammaproteobacteria bacterium]|nr:MAG: c-type cytochrome [Gammaproteobacteria bacterium]
MRNILLALTIGAWPLLNSGAVLAAGDVAAGQAKSALCAACHGPDGNSTNPEWPKLAGQQAEYIVKQLNDFKSGVRQNPLMAGITASLSEQDMESLAAYFSSRKVKVTGATDAELARQGQQLYRGGSRPLQVSACMACHGPAGQGVPPSFPSVSGQHAAYSEIQLNAFKTGVRKNAAMNAIAARMSAEEIKAVAMYMSGLEPAP